MGHQTSNSFSKVTKYNVSSAEITAEEANAFDVFEFNLNQFGGQVVFKWLDHLNNGTMRILQVTPLGDRVLLEEVVQDAISSDWGRFDSSYTYYKGLSNEFDVTQQVVTGTIILSYQPAFDDGSINADSTVEFFGCISYAGQL